MTTPFAQSRPAENSDFAMKIFKLRPDYTNHQAFELPMKDVILKLGRKVPAKQLFQFPKHNLSLASVWEEMPAHFAPVEGLTKGSSIPGVSVWTGGTLVLSSDALERLRSAIESLGEFLPVMTPHGQFWIFNCLSTVPVDEGNSRRVQEHGQTIDVEAIAFRGSDVGETLIFKTDYDAARSLFCTEQFKDLLVEHELDGLTFSEELGGAF